MELITGRAKKKVHGIAVMAVFIFFFSACLLAQQTFIGGYSVYKHTVSSQGNEIVNPERYWMLNYSFIAVGILMIPHFLYLYRRLMPTSPQLTVFFTSSGIMGGVSLILLGIHHSSPTPIGDLHNYVSDMAFNSFAITFLLSFIILIRRFFKFKGDTHKKPNLILSIFLYAILFFLLFIEFFLNDYPELIDFFNLDPLAVNFPFHEWLLMIICAFFLVFFYLIVPEADTVSIREIDTIQKERYTKIGFNIIRLFFLGIIALTITAIIQDDHFITISIIDLTYLKERIIFLNLITWESLFLFFIIISFVGRLILYIIVKKQNPDTKKTYQKNS